MKAVVILGCAAVAVLAFTGGLGLDFEDTSVPKPQEALGGANDSLEKAVETGVSRRPAHLRRS